VSEGVLDLMENCEFILDGHWAIVVVQTSEDVTVLDDAHQLIDVPFAGVEEALPEEVVVVNELKGKFKLWLKLLPDVVVLRLLVVDLQQDLFS
jgi:hypothetical protein